MRFWCSFYRFLGPISHSFHPCHVHTFMLITFFPRLWHGNCTAFTAEDAESAEKDRDWGKATANGTAFNAKIARHRRVNSARGGGFREQKTRKPEPGNRKKGAKGRGPEMPVAPSTRFARSGQGPEIPVPETSSEKVACPHFPVPIFHPFSTPFSPIFPPLRGPLGGCWLEISP